MAHSPDEDPHECRYHSAWEHLSLHFLPVNKTITKRNLNYRPTDQDYSAIEYLREHWDYYYE